MDKLLKDVLFLLDLSPLEIKFFEACFLLGNPTVSEAIKQAKTERSTGYLIAQQLMKKGFLQEDFKAYGKRITTADPATLLRILAAKQRSIGRKELEFRERLPDLQAAYQATTKRPRVRVFEETKGLLAIWNDILAENKEILLWTNQESEQTFFPSLYHQKFIAERIRKEIPIRVLAVHNKKAEALQKKDKESLRQTKLLPKETTFSAETYIYGNNVAIIDFNKGIIGIITESQQIASAQRAIFEMTWSHIKNY